jgi:hypothetical protein
VESSTADKAQSSDESEEKPEKVSTSKGEEASTQRYSLRSKIKAGVTLTTILICHLMGTILGAPIGKNPLSNAAKNSIPIPQCTDCLINCSLYGVEITVPKRITKFEICCGNMFECISQRKILNYHYRPSKEQLIVGYNCDISFWTNEDTIELGKIECPRVEACDLINCWVCLERFTNPNCRPDISIWLTGILGVSILFVMCFLIKLIRLIGGNCMCLCKLLWPKWLWSKSNRKRRYNKNEYVLLPLPSPKSAKTSRRISKIAGITIPCLLILGWMFQIVSADNQIDLIGTCQSTNRGWECQVNSPEETITILAGKEINLDIISNSNEIAYVETKPIGIWIIP